MRHLTLRTITALTICAATAGTTLAAATPANASPDDGKHVYTRQHVDAPVPAWDAKTQKLFIKASSTPAKDSVLWVPRGWRGNDPRHYFTIPDAPQLAFIGKSGQTWYAAPQDPGVNNTPIWAGIGADGSIVYNSANFEAGNYVLDFVNVNGPGRVEAFISNSYGVNRIWSSTDMRHRTVWNPRHMHHFTLFSKPGRYEVNVTAVARSKDGSKVFSSDVTPVVWQVGGTDPRLGKISDYGAAYNSARAQRTDGQPQRGTLTIAPKTRLVTIGDDKLSDITFTTGNTTDQGRVVILINGYYLAELPVENGRAAYDEFLGDENSTLQAIYIPEDTNSARYMTSPVLYFAGGKNAVSSAGQTHHVLQQRPAQSDVLDPNSHNVSDQKLNVTITPQNHSDDYAITLDGDTNLDGLVVMNFYSEVGRDIADCSVEGNILDGSMNLVADLSYCKNHPQMSIKLLPHPYSNIKPQILTLNNPGISAGLQHTFTLPVRSMPENHVQAAKIPAFKATPIVEDSTINETPMLPGKPTPSTPGIVPGTLQPEGSQPNNPGTVSPPLPPVVDTPPTPPTALNTPLTIHRGHFDMRLTKQANGWTFLLKDDSLLGAPTSVLRNPTSVNVSVSPVARLKRTSAMSAARFDFLGPVGTVNYVLPEVENSQLPWPGFSTEGIDYTQFPQGIDYYVQARSIPQGANFFFTTSANAGTVTNVLIDSRNPSRSVIRTEESTHLHGSWVFTKPGVYHLEVIARAGGRDLASAPMVFHVDVAHVGPDNAPHNGNVDTPEANDNSQNGNDQGNNGEGNNAENTINTPSQNTANNTQTGGSAANHTRNELGQSLLNNASSNRATSGRNAHIHGQNNVSAAGGGILGMLGSAANATPDSAQSTDQAQSAMSHGARKAVTTLRNGPAAPQSAAQTPQEAPANGASGYSMLMVGILSALAGAGGAAVFVAIRAMRS